MSSAIYFPGDSLSRRRRTLYILILGALSALGPLTIDLYLPALPSLAANLSASPSQVQWTLAGTTIGFAVGQALVGPLSDRVGRRRPLIASVTVHLVASVCVVLAPDIEWLIAGRVAQGFGSAAGVVVALAIARDLFGGSRLAIALSRLALVTGLAPILAPVVGSQLVGIAGWRGVFAALSLFSAIVLVATTSFISETLRPERIGERGHRTVRERYGSVLRDRRFWGAATIGGMNFTALFAYLSSSPFLFQDVFGFSAAQFGLVFAVNSVGVVAGIQIAARVAARIGPGTVLAWTLPGMALSMSAIALWGHGLADVPMVMTGLFLHISLGGACVPCIQLIALRDHARESGTAASLLGVLNFGLAGVLSPIIGLFPIHNALPMSIYMLSANAIALLALVALVRPWSELG